MRVSKSCSDEEAETKLLVKLMMESFKLALAFENIDEQQTQKLIYLASTFGLVLMGDPAETNFEGPLLQEQAFVA